jgi:hypothetical protein
LITELHLHRGPQGTTVQLRAALHCSGR